MTLTSSEYTNEPVAASVLTILQARLSDTLDLHAQLKQAHWNVKGPNFISLHNLFDQIAEEVDAASDEVAERIVALGGRADGRIVTTAKNSTLPEGLELAQGQSSVLATIASALTIHAEALRHAIDLTAEFGDAGTSDLFTSQSRLADKHRWLIQAHFEAPQEA
ncbi:DNA starvation/stationary phase protection protein Dps [Sulfitobacter sp. 20_GPM-1509m]|uniref:DNA starvation/stationary phase protection protein Dps n=1 Tax=Sulfitobacter sp. 20_GPM-1509m TaxID=1380367 RepID=UPI00055C3D0B|nr:DNA starvation/stationary phase protection protein Dps [Sulfitobacter sp. 20_GPM-1509m]